VATRRRSPKTSELRVSLSAAYDNRDFPGGHNLFDTLCNLPVHSGHYFPKVFNRFIFYFLLIFRKIKISQQEQLFGIQKLIMLNIEKGL